MGVFIMDGKKSFILYCDQIGLFKKLPDEQAGKLIKIIFDYVNDLNPEINDVLLDVAFDPIKLQLKRDLQKWEGIRKSRSDAGKASAEARKLKKEQASTDSTNVNDRSNRSTDSTVNVNDNVSVNDNVNDNVNDIKKNTEGDKPPVFMFKKSLVDYGLEKK